MKIEKIEKCSVKHRQKNTGQKGRIMEEEEQEHVNFIVGRTSLF